MMIANILHRETIEALVGARTFERGEKCFRARRVTKVVADVGQLRGVVRPATDGRADYEVRMWIKEDGLAYRCTCPVGEDGRFCKHAVATALAHLEQIETAIEGELADLARKLNAVPHAELVAHLVRAARDESAIRIVLARL
jgi:uncharacterized Zn finger protein